MNAQLAFRRRVRRFVQRWLQPRTFALALGLLFLLALALGAYLGRLSSLPAPFVDELEGSDSIQRLLVVAPHCDDEAIAAGALIRRVRQQGGKVRVVIVTNGDGSLTGTIVQRRKPLPRAHDYILAGMLRQQESLAAMAVLGVLPEDVLFLSYPDRGIAALWEHYWEDATPYRSPLTRLTRSIYPLTFNKDAVYSGHSLLADLRTILRDFQPDTVVAPHPEDSHPDHWATGAFVALALATERLQPAPRLLLYLVHRGDFPLPRGYLPGGPLLPPLRLVSEAYYWQKITFPDELVAAKAAAIDKYRSQMPLLGRFLRSFVRQNELFCELRQRPVPLLAHDQPLTPDASQWRSAGDEPIRPLVEDSARDTVPQEVQKGGDIVALYAARTADELWIAAELRGRASSVLTYYCLARAANGAEVARARTLYPPRLGRRPRTVAEGNFLLVRFSLRELRNPHTAVLTFEVRYPTGQAIDRIGWAILPLATGASP